MPNNAHIAVTFLAAHSSDRRKSAQALRRLASEAGALRTRGVPKARYSLVGTRAGALPAPDSLSPTECLRRLAGNGWRCFNRCGVSVDAGLIVLVALVSPFRAQRSTARARFEQAGFIEVFVIRRCPAASNATQGALPTRPGRPGTAVQRHRLAVPGTGTARTDAPASEIGIDECVAWLIDLLQRGGNIPARDEPEVPCSGWPCRA